MMGREANEFRAITARIIEVLLNEGYSEFIPSTLAPQEVFKDKTGPENDALMYRFKDKGDRDLCLIPEVTAVVQSLYEEAWGKSMKKPIKIFYLTRCYRGEKPQKGRYREFWQLGIECLGDSNEHLQAHMITLLHRCLVAAGLEGHETNVDVKRGLDYYTEDGFEVVVDRLGAQKQVAGGGKYLAGKDAACGWAIGIDRLMIAVYGDSIIGAI
jgi:histidyl-tRNA synthetase